MHDRDSTGPGYLQCMHSFSNVISDVSNVILFPFFPDKGEQRGTPHHHCWARAMCDRKNLHLNCDLWGQNKPCNAQNQITCNLNTDREYWLFRYSS